MREAWRNAGPIERVGLIVIFLVLGYLLGGVVLLGLMMMDVL